MSHGTIGLLVLSLNLIRRGAYKVKTYFFSLLLLFFIACDPEGKKQCAWTLEPEPNLIGKTEAGFIPVCARNRNTQKQDCRLQTNLEFAQKVWGKRFRYVDMEIDSVSLPRTIKRITFCGDNK